MRASLDTNAIIHFYKAGLENIIFEFFDEGVFIYEQIRDVELFHHGVEILNRVDEDIGKGKITVYTDKDLKEKAVYKIFEGYVNENKLLYGKGDLGEVYAISLAQTLGTYSLVTDDTKQGGPYMSLLQFDNEVMPFTFADILILKYLIGKTDANQTLADFDKINNTSGLNWSFRSQVTKFVKRFLIDPYRSDDRKWIDNLAQKYEISLKKKLTILSKIIKN